MKKPWKRLSQEDFVKKAKAVHNNRYTYDRAVFTTVNDKVTITCNKHGDFVQNANQHLLGSKCKKCAMEDRSKVRTKSTEDFIKRAIDVHGNRYDYSKAKYTKFSDKITITCSEHGDFEQHAGSHLRGAGCPICARLNPSNGWTFTEWEKYGLKSKNFIGFSLYILECWNSDERFIKVGKTFTAIEQRYDYKDLMPYSYKVIYRVEGSARYISLLEQAIHKTFKHNKQFPDITFNGGTECYPLEFLNDIHTYIKSYDDTTAEESTST